MEEVLAAVHKRHAISHSENANLKQDGSEILCEWLNAPFKDKHDQSSFIICMARDITEQKRLEQKLDQAAHYDSLTSLPNRALILDLLKQSVATAARQKTKLAILFLDLNDFKAVNDQLGHESGDILLMTIAHRLPQDIGSLKNARMVADKLEDLICQPCAVKDQVIAVSASVGISLYPDDAIEINALIHQADQNMYQTKQAARPKTR